MLDPIYLAGPTASGKSALALQLAESVGGEIISVDSMQVYRGLDIGTAKSSPAERARVPHHLIDVADLGETFDVARFLDLARGAEAAVRARGRVPIYCGGTGLYFKALVAGIGETPAADARLRQELEAAPLDALLAELQTADPETYGRIDRSNPRRVVRAIEVIRLTGRKFSAQRADWRSSEPRGRWFGLERDREDLVQRINRRVEEMFEQGLVEETRQLMGRGLEGNRTAMQSLGYRQVVEHLRGARTLEAAKEEVKIRTRQFAKRQMTWFRGQMDLKWVRAERNSTSAELAAQMGID